MQTDSSMTLAWALAEPLSFLESFRVSEISLLFMLLFRSSFHLRSVASRLVMRASSSQAAQSNHYPHGITSISGTTMAQCIARLGPKETFVEQVLVGSSRYIKPKTLIYQLDNKDRRWDAVETYDSLGIVIYNSELRSYLVVRQFRPAVYAAACRAAADGRKPDYEEGFTYELCAGLIDKAGLSLQEIAREEIMEECGYQVEAAKIATIGNSIANSGTGGSKHYMFHCEVTEDMRMESGGGLVDHGEVIELLSVPKTSLMEFILDPKLKISPGLQFGLLWSATRIISP